MGTLNAKLLKAIESKHDVKKALLRNGVYIGSEKFSDFNEQIEEQLDHTGWNVECVYKANSSGKLILYGNSQPFYNMVQLYIDGVLQSNIKSTYSGYTPNSLHHVVFVLQSGSGSLYGANVFQSSTIVSVKKNFAISKLFGFDFSNAKNLVYFSIEDRGSDNTVIGHSFKDSNVKYVYFKNCGDRKIEGFCKNATQLNTLIMKHINQDLNADNFDGCPISKFFSDNVKVTIDLSKTTGQFDEEWIQDMIDEFQKGGKLIFSHDEAIRLKGELITGNLVHWDGDALVYGAGGEYYYYKPKTGVPDNEIWVEMIEPMYQDWLLYWTDYLNQKYNGNVQCLTQEGNLVKIIFKNSVTKVCEFFRGDLSLAENIKNVCLPECVKDIESYAFNYAVNLVNIKPTALFEKIDSHAFDSCNSLQVFTIGRSLRNIGVGAFSYAYIREFIFDSPSINITKEMLGNCMIEKPIFNNLNVTVDMSEVEVGAPQLWIDGISDSINSFGPNAKIIFNDEQKSYLTIDLGTKAHWEGNTLCYGPDPNCILTFDYTGSYGYSKETLQQVMASKFGDNYDHCEFVGDVCKVVYKQPITRIPDNLFGNGPSINGVQRVVLPESVKSLFFNAFADCIYLKSINIENVEWFGTSSLSNIAYNNQELDLYFGSKLSFLGESVIYNTSYRSLIIDSINIDIPSNVFQYTALTKFKTINLHTTVDLSLAELEVASSIDFEGIQESVDTMQQGGKIIFSEEMALIMKGEIITGNKVHWDGNALVYGGGEEYYYYTPAIDPELRKISIVFFEDLESSQQILRTHYSSLFGDNFERMEFEMSGNNTTCTIYCKNIITKIPYGFVPSWSRNLGISVNMLDSVEEIDGFVFEQCADLYLTGGKIKKLGESVFEGVGALDSPISLTFNYLESIGDLCFRYAVLRYISISDIGFDINSGVFENTNVLEMYLFNLHATVDLSLIHFDTPPSFLQGIANSMLPGGKVILKQSDAEYAKSYVRSSNVHWEGNAMVYGRTQRDHELWYTSNDGQKVTPRSESAFEQLIMCNTYQDGLGVIEFSDPLTKIGNDAFINTWNIKTVLIPDSVTELGVCSFTATSLENVKIGNSVVSIGNSAFEYCQSLKSIFIPKSVSSIGTNIFKDDTALYQITSDGLKVKIDVSDSQVLFDIDSIQSVVDTMQDGGGIIFSEPSALYLKGEIITGTKAHWDGNALIYGTGGDYYNPVIPPDNQIWYRTNSGTVLNLQSSDWLISNEYNNGIGKITFNPSKIAPSQYLQNLSDLIYIEFPNNFTIQSGFCAGAHNLTHVKFNGCYVKLGNFCFDACNLQQIIFNCTTVYFDNVNAAFSHNRNLTSVVLPKKLIPGQDSEGYFKSMFYDCILLSEVKYKGTKSDWHSCMDNNTKAMFYKTEVQFIQCRDGYVDASPWKQDGC